MKEHVEVYPNRTGNGGSSSSFSKKFESFEAILNLFRSIGVPTKCEEGGSSKDQPLGA